MPFDDTGDSPGKYPECPGAVREHANHFKLRLILVTLADRHRVETFWAAVDSVPRKGEYVRGVSGKMWRVLDVAHVTVPEEWGVTMFVHISANLDRWPHSRNA